MLEYWDQWDIPLFPILVLYCLLFLITLNHLWKIYIATRQLRLCAKISEPPQELSNALPPQIFNYTRAVAMHNVEFEICDECLEIFFNFIEICAGFYPLLWNFSNHVYEDIHDNIWHGTFFAFLFTTYVVIRRIPIYIYDKLVLIPHYGIDTTTAPPLIGIICAFAFVTILLQTLVAPLTLIVVIIDTNGGYYFFIYIWITATILAIFIIILLTCCNIPLVGKKTQLQQGTAFYGQVEHVAKQCDFPISQIYMVQTHYIRKGAALVFGFCCFRRLIIFDTLFVGATDEKNHENEPMGLTDTLAIGVIAQALSHWKLCHFLFSFMIFAALLFIWCGGYGLIYYNLPIFQAIGFVKYVRPIVVGYAIMYMYIMPLYKTIFMLLFNYAMRVFEYRADRYTQKQLGYAKELQAALIKSFSDHVYFPYYDPLYKLWHRRKPTTLERLQHLKASEK